KKDENGACVETPADLFRRVARTIANVEAIYNGTDADRRQWEDRFYGIMATGAFMPNSPTLMNAGREMGMLSACFVLPVRDSITDIFDSIKHTALIQKAGGGTGFAFDELRPTGDYIKSSGGTTSGPISFWKAFSEATNAIQQGAFRRGANMGMMYIHHPDILKFLHAKQDLSQFTNYNISVKVTDAWMDEFREDADSPHIVRNPRTGRAYVIPRSIEIWKYTIRDLVEVDCVEPAPDARAQYYTTPRMIAPLPADLAGQVYTKRDIWNIIIQNAWHTGEPGVVFIDRINEHNPTPHVGRIEATNPCGEQPLLPYEACNLGSLNLGLFVRNACTPAADVDWDAMAEAIRVAVRFLDDVIDANNYPLPEIQAVCKANRKIGLGVMGFADALYRLNVAYNSPEAVAWGERFMQFLNDQAHRSSEQLARERGCFPNWPGSVWDTRDRRMMRNAAVTTVAPTGTISIIANCSGGIEPMFSLAFLRNVLKGQKQGERPLVELNDTFRQVAQARGFYSDELIERIAREGTLAHIPEIPEDIRRIFVCAHDITPAWHMQMQAAFQRHCDASISKTINFPNAATAADVEQIYTMAYELRCKGVTVYRDGCRAEQPMALKKGIEGSRDQRIKAGAEDPNAEPGAPATGHPGGTECIQCNEDALPPARGDTCDGADGCDPEDGHGCDAEDGALGCDAEVGPHCSNPHPTSSDPEHAQHAPDGSSSIKNRESKIENSAACPISNLKSQIEHPRSCIEHSRSYIEHPRSYIEPMDLPEIVSGLRIRQMTPFGNMHVKITVDPRSERELEIFAQLGKGGDVANSDLEGICRVASLWLRAGGSIYPLVKQWEGIGSSLQIPTRTGRIMSLPDGLAAALRKYLRAKERFGLRAILLGEVNWADLDNPNPPPHTPENTPMDRPLSAPARRPASASSVRGAPTDTGTSQTTVGPMSDPGLRPQRDLFGHDAPGGGSSSRQGNSGSSRQGNGGPSRQGNGGSSRQGSGGPRPRRPQACTSDGNGHGRSHEAYIPAGHAAEAEPAYEYAAGPAVALLEPEAAAESCAAAVPVARVQPDPGAEPQTILTLDTEPLVQLETRYPKPETPYPHETRFHDAAGGYKLHCPECGSTLMLQEGCRKCANPACGWAAC
ncbi:MAG: adenosylcobalamin-dependent ribonucleoside-diphosphate reductase, partial [Planctomycetota bacterium]